MTVVAVVVAVGVLLAIVVIALALWRRAVTDPERFPFTQCRPLSEREQVLYWRLRKVLPDQIVLSQVGLARILRVEKGKNVRAWLNRIDRMTVDFLICLPDATIVAAIELDDSSHVRTDRVVADAKKDKSMESAGIKLLRYKDIPSEEELRRAFIG